MEEYRMTVHLFGAASSPSCTSFALRKTAQDNCDKYDKEVIHTIQQNSYVDNYLKSVATEQQNTALRNACTEEGFKLTKWVSNSKAVMISVPEEDRAGVVKGLSLDREKVPIERALGMQWKIESDTFNFKVLMKDRTFTRRDILSVV